MDFTKCFGIDLYNGSLPDVQSMWAIQKAREEFIDVQTPYGDLLIKHTFEKQGGGEVIVEFLNP